MRRSYDAMWMIYSDLGVSGGEKICSSSSQESREKDSGNPIFSSKTAPRHCLADGDTVRDTPADQIWPTEQPDDPAMASSPAPPRVKKRTSSLNTVTNILTEYYFIFLHVALLLCCSLRLRASCERIEFASLIFQF
jgi:hypothetical protein